MLFSGCDHCGVLRYYCSCIQAIPIRDEAGYDVIKPTKKRRKSKHALKGASVMGVRSSSAENLCEAMEFDKLEDRGSISTNNSPQIFRRSPDRGVERGVAAVETPPNPEEVVDCQDHLYAQVVRKKKSKKHKKEPDGEEMREAEKGVAGPEAAKDGGGRDEVDIDGKGEEPEVAGIPSEAIQHENAGSHLYAVCINTKKGKKAAKSASLDLGNETTPTTMPTNNEIEIRSAGTEEAKMKVNGLDLCPPSLPVKPPRDGKAAPLPARPLPFSVRTGNTAPTSPGVDSGVSISSQGSNGGQGPERVRSPVRQAPPIPKSSKISTAPSPSSQMSVPSPGDTRARVTSISSKPPAFPPPPPPAATTPPPGEGVEDPAYAVVDQSFSRRKSRKQSDPSPTVPPMEKLVHVNSVSVSGTIPRASHTYTAVDQKSNGLISRTEALPVKSRAGSAGDGRRKGSEKGEKMRSHPSLPPRHTPPPPPPPPSSSQTIGSEHHIPGGQGAPQFLFSSNYASTLIKVSCD